MKPTLPKKASRPTVSRAGRNGRVQKTAGRSTKRPGTTRWANTWVQSPPWFLGFWIAVAVCLTVYTLNALFGRVHPASAWGLSYGVAATVLFVAVFLYALRRRLMRVRGLGRSWIYLQVHVYGGALFLLLVFMHVGFRWPQGVLTWWLWALSIWVVGSGLLGIVLQKWLPTLLSSGLTTEVHYDRIPDLVSEIRRRAETLVETSDYAIRRFYQDDLAPALAGPETHLAYYLGASDVDGRSRQFDALGAMLPAEERAKLSELRAMVRTKREIDAHYTLQKALRGWLLLHVPVSVVLLALLGFHIFTVLYY